MKKILIAAACLTAVASMVSCGSNGSTTTECKNLTDSTTYYLANVAGSTINTETKSMPEDMAAKFHKEDFLRGLKQALMADTNDVGYGFGLQYGLQFANQFAQFASQAGVTIDRQQFYNDFAKAFMADSVNRVDLQNNQMVLNAVMGKLQTRAMEKANAERERQEAEAAAQAKENEAKDAAFMTDLKAKDADIKTTESGLSYKVEQQGTGVKPGDNDRVKVIYTGKLTDGTVFDTSDGKPVTFSPRQVVPGFGEGLKMMNKGSKYTLYIPGNLGYGNHGTPDGRIAPGQTLIFDVEVVEVEPAK